MQAAFDPESTGPGYLYVKLADHLVTCIEDGSLAPGAMLPNERDLAMEYEVSVGTVRRATRLLRVRGLIITLPSQGSYVATPAPSVDTKPVIEPDDDGLRT